MHLSFEIFPPKTQEASLELYKKCESLKNFPVNFLSVTSGAMGARAGDIAGDLRLLSTGIHYPLVPHVTCTYGTKAELEELSDELWAIGCRGIVALRGDIPKGFTFTSDHCAYANELIALLKKRHDFDIYVGAYPEKHPLSPSLEADILNLRRKVDLGVTGIFTQFFFDPLIFLTFRDKIREAGIKVPLIAGLIPLYPYDKVASFAKSCHADIPEAIKNVFNGHEKPDEASLFLLEQCRQLTSNGIDGFHFYCLNRPDLIANTLEKLTF